LYRVSPAIFLISTIRQNAGDTPALRKSFIPS
jgi:hypothetical protein